MAALADAKTIAPTFSNAEEWVRVTYDFAVDAGATGDYTVLTADGDMVVTDFHASVETAATSAGSLVVDLGIAAGGTEFWSDKAVAALTIGAAIGMDTAAPVKLADAALIVVGLEAADATAGKIHFNFKVKKF